jgi:hypothetical protein
MKIDIPGYIFVVGGGGLLTGLFCWILGSSLGFWASAGAGAVGALIYNIGYDVALWRRNRRNR